MLITFILITIICVICLCVSSHIERFPAVKVIDYSHIPLREVRAFNDFHQECWKAENKLLKKQSFPFPINDFFSKCDQNRSFLQSWSHLLKKSVMENFIFCPVVIII